MRGLGVIAVVGATLLAGCRAEDAERDSADAALEERVALGPVDGHDLPGTELERVQVGHEAPDFTLTSLAGPTVTLSQYRGAKNVVLVFYRGHW
jgi:hypothetical protein